MKLLTSERAPLSITVNIQVRVLADNFMLQTGLVEITEGPAGRHS